MKALARMVLCATTAVVVGSIGCGEQVQGRDGARSADVLSERDVRFDAADSAVDRVAPGVDTPDVPYLPWDVPFATDVFLAPQVCTSGQCIPPDGGGLTETHQSCRGPNGAPAEHCREVWLPGGPFTMGAAFARKLPYRRLWSAQDASDIVSGEVHPGYIDAYPVSVARYRAYVRAGRPLPAVGSVIFNGYVWDRSEERMRGFNRICSYSNTAGEHDDLPMNCVNLTQMMAFCYWDGMHHITEPMWEYAATNGGTTSRPFGSQIGVRPCLWGDVSYRDCRPGTAPTPVPITAYPHAQTLYPAGIFGLWGGPPEYLSRSRVTIGSPFVENWQFPRDSENHLIIRGTSMLYELNENGPDTRGLSRSYEEDPNVNYGDFGIRCARWVPESRE